MSSSPIRISLTALAVCLVATAGLSQSITGIVVAQGGAPVSGATVYFSGTSSPSPVTTGVLGDFTASVSAGTYTVDVQPPVTTLAPARLEGVVVASGTVNLGIIALQPGFFLSGHVQTQSGAPVVSGDTDVIVESTGQKLFTPNDHTDSLGNFSVVVPQGTFHVEADAPTGQLLVSQASSTFTLTGSMNIGTIVLPPGVSFSGTVVNSQSFAALANVDVDVFHMATGVKVITPNDKTNAAGTFSIVIPTGTFRMTFDPPPGIAIVGAEFLNVVVTASMSVPIYLNPGFLLSGSVWNSQAQAVAGANIGVENVLGPLGIYVSNHSTLADGTFQVAVPVGTHRLKITPPSTSIAPTYAGPVVVSGATSVPPIVLQPGNVLSGVITGWNGNEALATVDVFDPSTGAALYTPNSVTNASGAYSVVVPSGTWNVQIRTFHLSLSRSETVTGVMVAGPTTLNHALGIVSVANYLAATNGVTTVANGSLFFFDGGLYNTSFAVQQVMISLSVFDPAGAETVLVPPFPMTLQPFDLIVALGLGLQLPNAPPAYLGFPYRLRFTVTDPATAAVIDFDEFKVTFY
jgi:hypothetical protein